MDDGSRRKRLIVGVALAAVVGIALAACRMWPRPEWTNEEVATLRSLWIGSLPQLPLDPSNRVADDPRAVALGKRLFFDERLSVNGKVACASCHQPVLLFQDGRPLARGVGTTTRKTMAIAGTAYSPWLFWDGRKDSQWAQALGPLESPVRTRRHAHSVRACDRRTLSGGIRGPLRSAAPAVRRASLSRSCRARG
jgi:cytochrome c peroxidase